jgi:uracil-DNA glycosylase family 4
VGEQKDRLEELYKRYIGDPSFALLKNRGANFVPGSGPLNPDIMIIGEKPGRSENDQGKPFVGKSGEELKYLLKGSDIDPFNVFLTCVVKFFSPIQQDKVTQTGFKFLQEEIEIVNPGVIGLCGLTVIKMFYPDIVEILPYNGKLLDDRFVPLYNPAAILHTPHRRGPIRKGYESLKKYCA